MPERLTPSPACSTALITWHRTTFNKFFIFINGRHDRNVLQHLGSPPSRICDFDRKASLIDLYRLGLQITKKENVLKQCFP